MGFCVIWISKLKQVALGRRMPKAAPHDRHNLGASQSLKVWIATGMAPAYGFRCRLFINDVTAVENALIIWQGVVV
jgi:hypothetical protein